MNTILDVLSIQDLSEEKTDLVDLINEEITLCRNKGDYWGAGEWSLSKIPYVHVNYVEELFVKTIAFWASPNELRFSPSNIGDLVSNIGEFEKENLSKAFITATARLFPIAKEIPIRAKDLSFRLSNNIEEIFHISSDRPNSTYKNAASKLTQVQNQLLSSIDSFILTNCVNAKIASIQLLKNVHLLRKYSLPSEKIVLAEIELLLGPIFRKFCEHCERQEGERVIERSMDLKEQANRFKIISGHKENVVLWHLSLLKIAQHLNELADEGNIRSSAATIPDLKLASNTFKIDSTRIDRELILTNRLLNIGEGRALKVMLRAESSKSPIKIRVLEPKGTFDINSKSEQLVKLGLTLSSNVTDFKLPILWQSEAITNRIFKNSDSLNIQQQNRIPDWDAITENPPYAINAIKTREDLFGRDKQLQTLQLYASGRTSSFLWGQKRVGKTSLIQVLKSVLDQRDNFICIIFRMGELIALHEGQLAYLIGLRIYEKLGVSKITPPAESDFGAGMSNLIPFVERLMNELKKLKIIIIIDEFDDLDSAFYTGERGRQFVKALRSLSEVGLTFFFVGSERMSTIYKKHNNELNKWKNMYLDHIDSRNDCRELVIKPVEKYIEYQSNCVDYIIDYCLGNPFYLHLLCSEIMERCLQENRTYVSEDDFESVKQSVIRSLGLTNFSHLWTDNPEIEEIINIEMSAENSLVLACLSYLGGEFENIDALYIAQEQLGLGISDRIPSSRLGNIVTRLVIRKVINKVNNTYRITLPIFRDWLALNAETKMIQIWKEFLINKNKNIKDGEKSKIEILGLPFPIPEEELLNISHKLIYLGKQKDVVEIRSWLKQFDDDVRIETAFLLLKRMAERGFVNEGARLRELEKLQEALGGKRLEIGGRAWKVVRGRKENLCITYVDSDTKSGAELARELSKRMRPGKSGPSNTIKDWMSKHLMADALILFIDDFAGTGMTLSKGLNNFLKQFDNQNLINQYLGERRILCYLQFALPEALEKLRVEFPLIEFLSTTVLGDDIRALEFKSGIYDNDEELAFSRDMLIQTGRELVSQHPLGYGDKGLLVCFHNTIPNNTLPIFWSNGYVNDRQWKPLFPRA